MHIDNSLIRRSETTGALTPPILSPAVVTFARTVSLPLPPLAYYDRRRPKVSLEMLRLLSLKFIIKAPSTLYELMASTFGDHVRTYFPVGGDRHKYGGVVSLRRVLISRYQVRRNRSLVINHETFTRRLSRDSGTDRLYRTFLYARFSGRYPGSAMPNTNRKVSIVTSSAIREDTLSISLSLLPPYPQPLLEIASSTRREDCLRLVTMVS